LYPCDASLVLFLHALVEMLARRGLNRQFLQSQVALKQHCSKMNLVDVFYLFQIDHCSVQL
jgi:hypothetical protein